MAGLIIIGNGVAGITLARHFRKRSALPVTIISSEYPYFFSRPAMMYVYMGHMLMEHTKPYEDDFYKKNEIDLVFDHVVQIETDQKRILLKSGKHLNYDQLVIATGSIPQKGGWIGEDANGVSSFVSKQDLDRVMERTRNIQKAVIVGGGLIGVELAEMMRSRGLDVSYLVRELKFWSSVLPDEEAKVIEQHIRQHGVELYLGEEVDEIITDKENNVTGLSSKSGKYFDVQFVGVAIGVKPNIKVVEGSEIQTGKGILVDSYFRTNIQDVYAIGDCAEFKDPIPGRPAIEQMWYTARMHGESLAITLTSKDWEYQPVNYFNSAKLFDLEYQVYSRTMFLDRSEITSVVKTEGNRVMRIYYRLSDHRFEGISLIGIRYRHEVCDHWLRQEMKVEEVLTKLKDANFDPEFSRGIEQDIVEVFNQKEGTQIKVSPRNWKNILLSAFSRK